MEEYYKVQHLLSYTFKYDIAWVETLMPWEVEIKLGMITDSIQKEIAAKGQ